MILEAEKQFCCYWKVKCSMSQQPQVLRGAGMQDAHPPQPDKDPVGLCPGSLLIGSQEVLHHGNPPARQGHRSAHRVWEQEI